MKVSARYILTIWLMLSAVQAVYGFGFFILQAHANGWYDNYTTVVANDRGFDPSSIGFPDATRPGWFSGRYGIWEQDFQEEMGKADGWWNTSASNGMRRFCYLGECGMDETLVFYNNADGAPYALGYNSSVFLQKLTNDPTFSVTARWMGMESWYSSPAWSSYVTPAELGLTNFINPDGSYIQPGSNFVGSLARLDISGSSGQGVGTDSELSDDAATRLGITNVSYKENGKWVVNKTANRMDFGNPQVLKLLEADTDYMIDRMAGQGAPGIQGIDGVHVDGLNHALSLYSPQNDAFGNWSRYLFKDYLSATFTTSQLTAMGVTNATAFDIRDYIRQKGWAYGDTRWNSDKVWQFYKIYYTEERLSMTASLRNSIKTRASSNGLDLAISGNMIPIWPGLGLQDNFLDICYFEWVPETGFGLFTNGLPYQGGRMGFIGRLASKVSQASYSWASMSVVEDDLKGLPELHKTIAFNCFANRLISDWNYHMLGNRDSPGTTNSFKQITEFIKAATAAGISSREYVTDIGVVYDPWAELASVTVSNCFVEPFTEEFCGWCNYLEDHQLQWDVLFCKNNLQLSDLQKYKIIILPSYSTINANAAAAVETYVQNGGYVISTGITGSRYADSGYLMPRSVNIFNGFSDTNFHQTTNTPGLVYVENSKDSAADASMESLMSFTNFQSSLVSVSPAMNAGINLNTYAINGDPRMTVDIVNWDYDLVTDTMTPTPQSWVTFKLPTNMTGAATYNVKYIKSSNTNTYSLVNLPTNRVAIINSDELSIKPYQTTNCQILFIDAQ